MNEPALGSDVKVCPQCAEQIKAAAQVCRYCGHRFEPSATDIGPSLRQADRADIPDGSDAAPPARRGGRRAVLGGFAVLAVLVGVAVVALAGPGGAFLGPGARSTSPTHVLSGTFKISDTFTSQVIAVAADSSCRGTGPYGDIGEGTAVSVKDGAGNLIGTATLQAGTFADFACTFPFAVQGVPEVAFYAIEVAHRGAVNYSMADLRANGWAAQLSLASSSLQRL